MSKIPTLRFKYNYTTKHAHIDICIFNATQVPFTLQHRTPLNIHNDKACDVSFELYRCCAVAL